MNIFSIIQKEWLLLWHDKASLIIIFVMPMCLVLILTILEASNPRDVRQLSVLLINPNTSILGKAIDKGLKKIDHLKIKNITKDKKISEKEARTSIAEGAHQALIIVSKKSPVKITMIFDPAIPKALESTVVLPIKLLVKNVQLAISKGTVKKISRLTRQRIPVTNKKVTLYTTYASQQEKLIKPKDAQQIVPAWTLFGMFLIIIPLGSIIIKERDLGILQRLYVTPSYKFTFLFGRVIAFGIVNLIQWALMFALGLYILPLFNITGFSIAGHLLPLFVVASAIAFAATGFGILIGSWSRTFEQATAIGPILIVIGAAIGGIFAPVYAMPESLRAIAEYSPLHWGQNAFLEILVRNSDFEAIIPDLSKLIIFGAVCISLALLKPFISQKFSALLKR